MTSGRLVAAGLAVMAALATAHPSAGAQQPPAPAVDPNGGWGQAGGTPGAQGGGGPGHGGAGGGSQSPSRPGPPIDWDVVFVEDGTGTGEGAGRPGCWAIAPVAPGQGTSWEEALMGQAYYGQNGALWGPCAVAAAAPVVDPAAVAAALWAHTVQPPAPSPLTVAPGWAITGLPAYLEIGGVNPAEATYATPIGPATFVMTARYEIAWGDGATASSTGQGRPWPGGDGEIRHAYTDVGQPTITVHAYWHASWTLAGAGGQLAEHPMPTEAALSLDVEQRQVVID